MAVTPKLGVRVPEVDRRRAEVRAWWERRELAALVRGWVAEYGDGVTDEMVAAYGAAGHDVEGLV